MSILESKGGQMTDCIECGYELHSNREIDGFETCIECSGEACDYCSSKAAHYDSKEQFCDDCYSDHSLTGALRHYNANTDR